MELLTDIKILLMEFAVPLTGAVILYLLALLRKFALAKISSEMLRQASDIVVDATSAAVLEIQQTLVDKAKDASADGRLSAAEIAGIKAAALEAVKRNAGKRGLAVIMKVFGLMIGSQLDGFLTGRTEATLSAAKQENAENPLR